MYQWFGTLVRTSKSSTGSGRLFTPQTSGNWGINGVVERSWSKLSLVFVTTVEDEFVWTKSRKKTRNNERGRIRFDPRLGELTTHYVSSTDNLQTKGRAGSYVFVFVRRTGGGDTIREYDRRRIVTTLRGGNGSRDTSADERTANYCQ